MTALGRSRTVGYWPYRRSRVQIDLGSAQQQLKLS